MRLLFILALSMVLVAPASAQTTKATRRDSLAVKKTLDGFLDTFTNLKWEPFAGYFADDASVFFPPSAKTPARANTKAEVERIFKLVFENARKGKSTPPYLDIQPKDLRIQVFGSVAVATFHLLDPGFFGRRTIVMRKDKFDNWKIVHLHASAIAE